MQANVEKKIRSIRCFPFLCELAKELVLEKRRSVFCTQLNRKVWDFYPWFAAVLLEKKGEKEIQAARK